MTVIAWDGTTLAADRRVMAGSTPINPVTKVRRILAPNGCTCLIGFSGSCEWEAAYLYFMDGGPEPLKSDEAKGTLILIDDERNVWTRSHNSIAWNTFGKRQWAIGCGVDYALGAMHAGADAVKAVQVASELDVNCGDGFDEVAFAAPLGTRVTIPLFRSRWRPMPDRPAGWCG